MGLEYEEQMYIAIDGDDFGRKIAACYINNDERKLRDISETIVRSSERISGLLVFNGFRIVFCAADGVAAFAPTDQVQFGDLFDEIRQLASPGFTFSAGVGASLREAYIALLDAKCAGKDRLTHYTDIHT